MGGQRDVNNAPPITAYGFDESLTNFEGMGPKLLPLTEKRDKDGNARCVPEGEDCSHDCLGPWPILGSTAGTSHICAANVDHLDPPDEGSKLDASKTTWS